MDIDKLIKDRRSNFPAQYSGDTIPDEVVARLLKNANWAPNHYHTEPWRFKVYHGKGLHKLFESLAGIYSAETMPERFSEAKVKKYDDRKSQVSHVIAIVVEKSLRPDLPYVEEVCATACAVQNLWLTLSTYKKYGGYWSTGHLVYTNQFRQFLGLKENQVCLGLFYLGTLKEPIVKLEGRRNSWKDKVEYIIS